MAIIWLFCAGSVAWLPVTEGNRHPKDEMQDRKRGNQSNGCHHDLAVYPAIRNVNAG